jgi:hypothetical protein
MTFYQKQSGNPLNLILFQWLEFHCTLTKINRKLRRRKEGRKFSCQDEENKLLLTVHQEDIDQAMLSKHKTDNSSLLQIYVEKKKL